MENAGRNVNGLSAFHGDALRAEAHLAFSFDDEVDLLLFLVVPGNLTPFGLQSDVAHGKVGGLNGGHAAHEILGAAASRIGPALDLA